MTSQLSTITTDSLTEPLDDQWEDVLQFWFPNQFDADLTTILHRWNWWFRGGADADVAERFSPLWERAMQGKLDSWASKP